MDKEKEFDLASIVSIIQRAKEEAFKRSIEANTIIISKELCYIKPDFYNRIPPMIMGMEAKVSDKLPNDAAFIIFKADITERDRLVAEARRQAVKEFANYLCDYAMACKESGYDGIGAQDIKDKFKELYGEEEV